MTARSRAPARKQQPAPERPQPAGGLDDLLSDLARTGGNQAAIDALRSHLAAGPVPGDQTAPVPQRAAMEQAFGTSLAHVQAHTGPGARVAAEALATEAFAVGSHVVFGTRPTPDVVAHELAHTVQQTGIGLRPGPAAPDAEGEADRAAASVAAGEPAVVTTRAPLSVQRWGAAEHYEMGNTGARLALEQYRQQPGSGGTAPAGVHHRRRGVRRPTDARVRETMDVQTGDGRLSFGSLTRQAGDLTNQVEGDGVDALHGRSSEVHHAGEGAPATVAGALDSAELAFYARNNASHFYPLTHEEYARHHRQALQRAQQAHGQSGAERQQTLQQALEYEAFGCHFLHDAFASGHMVPRPLDRYDPEAHGRLAEARTALTRSKPWHDVFCMLPDGLPTTLGRFHGDHHATSRDISYISRATAKSIGQVFDAADGRPGGPEVQLPAPSLPGILADPVAGPLWQSMTAPRGSAHATELAGYGDEQARARGEGGEMTTAAGTEVSRRSVARRMDRHVFGRGGGAREPTSLDDARERALAQLEALRHYLERGFGVQRRSGLDDNLEPAEVDAQPRFGAYALHHDFGMFDHLRQAAAAYHGVALATDQVAGEAVAQHRALAEQLVALSLDWFDHAENLAPDRTRIAARRAGLAGPGRAELELARAITRAMDDNALADRLRRLGRR